MLSVDRFNDASVGIIIKHLPTNKFEWKVDLFMPFGLTGSPDKAAVNSLLLEV
jgi:hypothetical protein